MSDSLLLGRAADLIRDLDLAPHPEGGFFREVFRSPHRVQPLDGRPERSALTTIHFLLPRGAHSRWHRVGSDEVWHFIEGDPLVLTWVEGDGAVRGATLSSGVPRAQPVAVVPAGCWQTARPLGAFALVGCTVGPGFDFADFEMLDGEDDSWPISAVAPGADDARISEALRRAYAAALYRIGGAVPATFTVGTDAADVSRWLGAVGARAATVVTGWNPFSRPASDAANADANARLRRAVADAGLACVDARGTDPGETWGEDSLCVFDASDDAVDDWLRSFDQYAVLVLRRGEAPGLRWHPAYRELPGASVPPTGSTGAP